jgi:hypothetical protein
LLYFKTKKVKTTRYTIHQGGEGMNKSKRIGSAQKQIKWIIFGSGAGIQKPIWTKKPVPTSFIKKSENRKNQLVFSTKFKIWERKTVCQPVF